MKGGSGTIYVRSSADGVFDSPDEQWQVSQSSILPQYHIDMQSYQGRLFQSMQVNDGKGSIAIRSTSDGLYDSPDEDWKIVNGQTKGNVHMEVWNDKLYFFVRGHSNTKDMFYSSIDSPTIPTTIGWKNIPGETSSDINAKAYNGNLYITIRGVSGVPFTKIVSSDDFISPQWNKDEEEKYVSGDISISTFNNKLYYIIHDTNGYIWSKIVNY